MTDYRFDAQKARTAALACWGTPANTINQPEPPADGEVAELVACLRREADVYNCHDHTVWLAAADLHRAADLLERMSEPEPEGPTDEDLVELACAEVYNSRNWEEPECTTDDPYPYEASSFAWLNFARAVLARWGNQS
jgi:hypothetical protein